MLAVRKLNAFYGQAHVLFDLDFDLPNDSLTGLLGRNGAGKTTTARAILGMGCRTTGSIRYCDKEMSRLPTYARAAAGIQLVPEDRCVYGRLKVRENLELGTYALGSRAPLALDRLLDVFPTLTVLLERYGNQLSGGEQQLVAIARALVARPSVLIMDEPSQGLAPVVLEQVGNAITVLRQEFGTVILLTEQNVRFVTRLADSVLVIDKGTVVFSGKPDELSARTDIHQRYLSV